MSFSGPAPWAYGSGTVLLTPAHVEYYNAIYTKGNPAPSILFWELSTAVSEYPGFRVPDSSPGCGLRQGGPASPPVRPWPGL